MTNTIAFIAHDTQKDNIVNFSKTHVSTLSRYRLIATATTGKRIQATINLPVKLMLLETEGGTVQIAAEVALGNVAAVIFLIDPLQTQSLEVQTLLRICTIYNVPIAFNLASAEAIATRLSKTLVAHLIFNPVAGQGNPEQDLALIRQLLEPHLSLHIHQTTPETQPASLVKAAIAARADFVIASGGDGTVSAVAGALIGEGVPLGLIPRGTANAFATALGLSELLPIRNACQVILAGQTQTVDAAYCNDVPMILLAGVGYEATVVEKANRELKNQWGALAYLMAGWQSFDEQELFEAELEAEGEIHRFQAGAITIANAAPPTSILAQGAGQVIWNDGLLDVTVASAENKMDGIMTMLRMLGTAMTQTELQDRKVGHGRTQQLKLKTNPPQKVVVDGEIIGTTPIEVKSVPGGLTVLVPKSQPS
jgi:YegS/Rv2252/BmrU family lipid kinase